MKSKEESENQCKRIALNLKSMKQKINKQLQQQQQK